MKIQFKYLLLLTIALGTSCRPEQQRRPAFHIVSESTDVLYLNAYSNELELISQDSFHLGLVDGRLVSGVHEHGGASPAVQTDARQAMMYMMLFGGDTSQNGMAWCKLFRLNISDNELVELHDFGKQLITFWRYLQPRNEIVYLDRQDGIIKVLSLSEGASNDLLEEVHTERNIAFDQVGSVLHIHATTHEGVVQLSYNLSTGTTKKPLISPEKDFSSAKGDLAVSSSNGRMVLYKNAQEQASNKVSPKNGRTWWSHNGNRIFMVSNDAIVSIDTDLNNTDTLNMDAPEIIEVVADGIIVGSGKSARQQLYHISNDLQEQQLLTSPPGDIISIDENI